MKDYDHMRQQALAIRETLGSAAHYEQTPAVIYAHGFDPLLETKNHLQPCVCGLMPEVRGREDGKGYQVSCSCGQRSQPAKHTHIAILLWNTSGHSIAKDYRELPLFGLKTLTKPEARERLMAIHADLNLRVTLAGLERDLGDRVGWHYQQRLKAFKAWCSYALRCVKATRPDYGSKAA